MKFYTDFFYVVLVLFVAISDVLCEKNKTEERVKRNNGEFHAHPAQSSRKGNDVKAFSPSLNKLQPPSPTSQVRQSHTRSKPIHVPPYAVKMEPLVQYSQRDPLYHDKEVQFNITTISEKHSKDDNFADSTNNFVDYSPHYGAPHFDQGYPPHHYYKEPEPIIEIIIKESNESLPAPPVTSLPTPKPSKEPIQVFYVKYKKNPSAQYGKDEVIYEEPIPALTPVSTDIVESHPTEPTYPTAPYTNPPPPSTTLRTIIRPDSEVYHGSGLRVTFGKHGEESYSGYEHRSIEAQKRDSVDTPEVQDFKPSIPTDPEPPQSPPKHLLEQRQSQNDFVRFVNSNAEVPQSHTQQRPSTPLHNVGLSVPALQFEDGSYEKPPPPTYNTNTNHPQQRNAFSSQIPFRPQHTLNFPSPNSEFSPDLRQGQFQHPGNNLQNTKQHSPSSSELNQPPFQHISNNKPAPQSAEFTPEVRQTHFQHPINVPPSQTKLYPRITQAILPQSPFAQQGPPFGQFSSQETSFNPNKHLLLSPNDITRLQQIQKQSELNKHNAGIPFSPQAQHHQHQQIPFRGDFSQFQNQKVQFQQPLLHQNPLHLQQQQQHSQSQHSQLQQQHAQSQQQHSQSQPQHAQSQPQPQHIQPQPQHIQPQPQHSQQQPQHVQPQSQHTLLQPQYAQLTQQHALLQAQHNAVQQQHAQIQPQLAQSQSQHIQAQSHQNQVQTSQHQPLSYTPEKPLIDRPKLYEKQKSQTNQKPVLQRKPFDSEKFQSQDYLNQLQTNEKFQQEFLSQFQTEKPQQPILQPNYKEVVSARQKLPQKSTQNTKSKNESPSFQDGQIYQSISQSEDHQILNQLEPFSSNTQFKPNQNQNFQQVSSPQEVSSFNTQSKPNQNQNIQYVSSPQEVLNFNKSPKQSFEQFTAYTTPKPATKKESKANVTYSAVTKATVSKKEKNDTKNLPAALAALPAEVPDDLREQLLSSGILSNADIQILDYDKVGDIPIESLPPEALENLYGAGSAPVPSFAFPNTTKSVEMKVVRYNSNDTNVQSSYVQEDSTEVDPVVLNDSSYNRYLPLKVKGSQFPIPDSPLLKNKKITSVVVLAPVDYDYVQQKEQRKGKTVPQVHGVRFISGESLRTLVKTPTTDNFLNWIEKEKETPPNKQSVILLVTNSTNDDSAERTEKEIFMYDIPTGEISKLEGELSSAFVNVAESNAESEDLDNLSENSDGSTPVISGMTSIPVYGTMSDQFKIKSRTSS